MGRLGLAFSTFFKVLGNAEFAEAVRSVDPAATKRLAVAAAEAKTAASAKTPAAPKPAAPPAAPSRSDAITLLAALQREARLVDFLMEEVSGYADAQIGAAVRDVHRSSRSVLQRMFQITPLRTETEGASIEVPKGFDPLTTQLVGKVAGEPPFRGTLTHAGWRAEKLDLPAWNGNDGNSKVIAPAEVELG